MASADENTFSSDFNPTNVLVLTNVLYPVIDQMEKSCHKDVRTDLRTTLFKLEEIYPGFSRNFLQSFLQRDMPSSPSITNLNELTLKLEKSCEKSPYFISNVHNEQVFHELNSRTKNLKRILSRIPDDINEKREFLETIKEIASAIKKTLDSVTSTLQHFKTAEGRYALETEKKEFIKHSKKFSNTLKAYFRDNNRDEVFMAANHLLVQIDYLLRTIKLSCEANNLDECLYPLLSQHQNQIRMLLSYRNASSIQNQYNIRQPSNHSNSRQPSTYETNYS